MRAAGTPGPPVLPLSPGCWWHRQRHRWCNTAPTKPPERKGLLPKRYPQEAALQRMKEGRKEHPALSWPPLDPPRSQQSGPVVTVMVPEGALTAAGGPALLGLLSAPVAPRAALPVKQAFGHIHLSGRPEVPVSRDRQALGALPALLLPRIPPPRGDKFTETVWVAFIFIFFVTG